VQRLGVCNQYKVTFSDKLILKFEKEIPLDECLIDGHFILSDKEVLELRRAYRDAKECDEKRKCKAKGE
jgi:hypothetical protein